MLPGLIQFTGLTTCPWSDPLLCDVSSPCGPRLPPRGLCNGPLSGRFLLYARTCAALCHPLRARAFSLAWSYLQSAGPIQEDEPTPGDCANGNKTPSKVLRVPPRPVRRMADDGR